MCQMDSAKIIERARLKAEELLRQSIGASRDVQFGWYPKSDTPGRVPECEKIAGLRSIKTPQGYRDQVIRCLGLAGRRGRDGAISVPDSSRSGGHVICVKIARGAARP